ncbi:LysR family transcriptional regulator [Acidipila sp. EB88]|uniref:LysR family transcriptional regulator n=1 Tax=Acidipila sp. EB88 TaxID=2305226 RepID=UPI000F5D971F|nr:LysR family transcriptional regulator [Acidipila sp. EB88]RRA47613.1 LysR family transcriptional regulator [Acidipila sp. EB88]
MTDLNSLVAFARVVEAGSFAEAARRMKMPTSTLSRRIAELENQLGVRLLDRSTRRLRLTDVGAELLEHAERGAQVSDAVASIASNYGSTVSGTLRLSAPPSISDSFLAPLIIGFQARYTDVRVQVLIAERAVDHIADGVDLVVRIGQLSDSALVGRKLISYRHQLLATPDYLKRFPPIRHPEDLAQHRLLSFARWKPRDRWIFEHVDGKQKETLFFEPYLSMNDYAGLAPVILQGVGIGELPPIVLPGLSRKTSFIEVMPKWRFRTFDLWLLHLNHRHLSQAVRAFRDFAIESSPALFPNLPR